MPLQRGFAFFTTAFLQLDIRQYRNYNAIIKEGIKMNMPVRSKVVKIGNSRGIRIPRILLEQAGLTDVVEMVVEGNQLTIHNVP